MSAVVTIEYMLGRSIRKLKAGYCKLRRSRTHGAPFGLTLTGISDNCHITIETIMYLRLRHLGNDLLTSLDPGP